jgi:ketosteroid isomerase-like protein
MSEENVEIVRRLIQDWGRGDYSSALGSIDPEIEVNVAYQANLDGTYRGHAGLAELMGPFWAAFEGQRIEIEEAIPVGSDVVVGVRFYGRGVRSGVEIDGPPGTFGVCARGKQYAGGFSARSKRPSKPPGCGSRRCRRRTSRSCGRAWRRTTGAISTLPFSPLTPRSSGCSRLSLTQSPVEARRRSGVSGKGMDEAFEDFRLEPQEFVDAGDHVVVRVRFHGSGRESGVETEGRMHPVHTLRDGRVVRIEFFNDWADALEAAGVRE